MGHGVVNVKHHETYYLRDGNVCFLVQDTEFRLHRYFFDRESKFFQKLFQVSPGETRDSSDGTNPPPRYKLDVTVEEFSTLCWLWYNPKYNYARRDKDTWLTILSLAVKWQFEEIKRLAISQLQRVKIEPVERIEIYKKFNVDEELLLPSYVALCKSPTLPSPADAEKLTMETVLRIAAARERALLSIAASGCPTPTSGSAADGIIVQILAELFHMTPHSNDKDVPEGGQVSNNNSEDAVTVNLNDPVKKKSQNSQMEGRVNARNTANSNNVQASTGG